MPSEWKNKIKGFFSAWTDTFLFMKNQINFLLCQISLLLLISITIIITTTITIITNI